MELSEVEAKLKFAFPDRHRQALLNPNDPIHELCAFLVISDSDTLYQNICRKNEWLHSSDFNDPWPNFLIAFASNQSGDYFAYDTRKSPVSIVYIDPDKTVEENLQDEEALWYNTFEQWYKSYTMKLPKAEQAFVDIAKLRDYSLDIVHKEGKHKARVFAAALGLTRNDADWFREQLLVAAKAHDCRLGKMTDHGQRYILDFTLNRNQKSAMVRSVWNIRPDEDFPRLITCYVL
ncbi:MAG TPA: SMI1/KNR4 family protein [Verrucomicrobiae bacterium]|jgi:hypothetical protein